MSPEAFKHYKTDIDEIDKQHLDILNKASQIVKNRKISLVDSLVEIENLKILFINHLIYEEELMRQINYKYLNAHIASHERLKFQFDKILDQLKNPNYNKTFVIETLDKILLDYVDYDDRQYIHYYAEYLKTSTIG